MRLRIFGAAGRAIGDVSLPWTGDGAAWGKSAAMAASSLAMLDFFAGYVSVLHSSEFMPGGAQMSQDCGRRFAQGILKKRQEGRL